jgi:1-deoxy-D-xylulose-5-phosphate synthase
MVSMGLKAAHTLAESGINTQVINARFVKPLDETLLLGAARTVQKIIIAEEHVLAGGFGSALLEMFADHGMTDLAIKRVGIDDCFVEHGPQDVLKAGYGLDETALVTAGLELYGSNA